MQNKKRSKAVQHTRRTKKGKMVVVNKGVSKSSKKGTISSGFLRNTEALVNPKTGLASVVNRISKESKPFMESFLKSEGLSVKKYSLLSTAKKASLQKKWLQSSQYKKLSGL